METWESDFAWLRIRHLIKDRFGKESLPDLNAILFLIGIQELGRWKAQFTKEEKQDLMHIAVCRLLSYEGYYEFVGRDADGVRVRADDEEIGCVCFGELGEQFVQFRRLEQRVHGHDLPDCQGDRVPQ